MLNVTIQKCYCNLRKYKTKILAVINLLNHEIILRYQCHRTGGNILKIVVHQQELVETWQYMKPDEKQYLFTMVIQGQFLRRCYHENLLCIFLVFCVNNLFDFPNSKLHAKYFHIITTATKRTSVDQKIPLSSGNYSIKKGCTLYRSLLCNKFGV